jgi:hypothetical protein
MTELSRQANGLTVRPYDEMLFDIVPDEDVDQLVDAIGQSS